MLSMYLRKEVINYFITYGYGAKRIRSVMLREGKEAPSRNTIRKYLNRYKQILRSKGKEAALDYLKNGDGFHTPERQRTKLDSHAREYIEGWIKDNEYKKTHNLRKQCVDMVLVWRHLREQEGYDVGYSTVTAYARDYITRVAGEKKSRECFIKQFHPAGEECQFDWGDVKLKIGGKWMTLRMAAFVLPHSNHRRGYLFICENTLAFEESHRNYFHDIGHIPLRMVYDNMKVAVKAFVGTEKEPTDALLDLSSFYGFQWRFCNIRSGNEKGNVEETVKVLRKLAFSMRNKFASIEGAQAWLDKVCEKYNHEGLSDSTVNVERLAEEDFAAMRPCTDDFGCFELIDRKVNNLGVITVGGAYYSVPDTLVGDIVSVRNYTNKIEVLSGRSVVAEHEKVRKGEWHTVLWHYLHTLGYKPGALKNAVALRQAPEGIRRVFEQSFCDNPKDFIMLLSETQSHGMDYSDIISAHAKLKECHVKHVNLLLMESEMFGRKEGADDAAKAYLLQDASDIETFSEKGLEALAGLMGNHEGRRNAYGSE